MSRGWLNRRWFEFRLGHRTYLAFLMSFIQFVLIVYELFLEQVFQQVSLLTFSLMFLCFYIPFNTLLGHFHIKKQSRYDSGMITDQNPVYGEIVSRLKRIEEAILLNE